MAAQLRGLITAANGLQTDMRHWLVKDLHGERITHPQACADLKVRCPFSVGKPMAVVPGRSGTYELLISNGRFVVGQMRQDMPHAYQGS